MKKIEELKKQNQNTYNNRQYDEIEKSVSK